MKRSTLFFYSYISDNAYQLNYIPFSVLGKRLCAFTASELMAILPSFIVTENMEPFNGYRLRIEKNSSLNIRWLINYWCDTYAPPDYIPYKLMKNIFDEYLPDALGQTLIFLIENGLYKVET